MNRPSTVLLPVLFLSLHVIVPDATAEMDFHPGITLRESYDDNIFLTADNEKDDFITTVTPNINLVYAGNRLDLSLGYSLIASFYAKNSDQNELHQSGTLASKLSIIRDTLFLKVDDTYSRVTIDQRKQTTVDSTLVNQTDTNSLKVNPYLVLPLSSKISYHLGYTYENLWYNSSDANSAQNHTLATGLSAQFSERIGASLNYSYLFHRPTSTDTFSINRRNPEYDKQDVTLGLTLQVSPKLSLSGTVGETFISYRDSVRSDSSNLVWSAKGDYRLTENLSFNGGYSVSYSDSVDQGIVENNSGTAGIRYSGDIPLSVVFSDNKVIYQNINREDDTYGVRVDASLPLGARMQLKIVGMYSHCEFLQFLREDERADRYGAQASMEYNMKIVTLSLGYTYNRNDSNINSNDYRDNIIFIQAKSLF